MDCLGSSRSRASRSGMNSGVVSDSVGSQGTCNTGQQFPWCSARCTVIQLQAVHSPWEIRLTSHLVPSSQGRWVLVHTATTTRFVCGLWNPVTEGWCHSSRPAQLPPSCFLSLFFVSSSAYATESRPGKGRQLRETFVGPGIVTPEETGHSLSEGKQPVYTAEERASEPISSTTLPGNVVPLWPCLWL